MRILIASDAWYPQINGVVRTLSAVVDELRGLGHEVEVLGRIGSRPFPCRVIPRSASPLFPGSVSPG